MPRPEVTILSLEAIDNFHSSLSAKGRSVNTKRAYTTDLKTFLQDLGESEIELDTLEELAMSWLTLNRRILAPKTTRRRITSLREFAKWAGLPANFLASYSAPTPGESEPHPLPEGLSGIDRLVYTAKNEKVKALVALCGYMGLRVFEALAVKPSHFSFQSAGGMSLKVLGKGSKVRMIPVPSHAWDVLAMPIGRAFADGDNPVVGLQDRYARRVITELGEKAGLMRRIASHDLRATFATWLYEKTRDIRLVQIALGHASTRTTEMYIGINAAKIRKAMER